LATALSICSCDRCINAWVVLAMHLPVLGAEHGQILAEASQSNLAWQHCRAMMPCLSAVRSAPQGMAPASHLYCWISPVSVRAHFSLLSSL
jgi:hypothetical protein